MEFGRTEFGALRAIDDGRRFCNCDPPQPARIVAAAHTPKAQRIDPENVFIRNAPKGMLPTQTATAPARVNAPLYARGRQTRDSAGLISRNAAPRSAVTATRTL